MLAAPAAAAVADTGEDDVCACCVCMRCTSL
jgi:hypothetical protein